MFRLIYLRQIVCVFVFLSSLFGSPPLVFGQTEEDTSPISSSSDDQSGNQTSVMIEKGEFSTGESSNFDAGKPYVFLPFVATEDDATARAATTTATWQRLIEDEFCAFPNGWFTYDANGTGQSWRSASLPRCAAQPSGYVNKMNTMMTRQFSLVGALDARVSFSLYMNTEARYDFLRYEYSCDSGLTWRGSSHQQNVESGNVSGWLFRTMYLTGCMGRSDVRVRFIFQTDSSVTGTMAPALDFVWVEKLQ